MRSGPHRRTDPTVGSIPRDWRAPRALSRIDAVVRVPGSKSMTNRAVALAALSAGRSRVNAPLQSRDTALMVGGLRALGVGIESDGADWIIDGARLSPVADHIDVGNAGTVARFLPPLAALADAPMRFDGDARIRERPLGPLIDALRALGVRVDDDGRGALPMTVHGTGYVGGGPVTVDASSSSQIVSGLLLAGSQFDKGVEVRHVGPPVPSSPHLAMTVSMLRSAGAGVDTADNTWLVHPGPLTAGTVVVEPDLSGAAPFLAAAAVTGGRVTISGWPATTTQPGAALPDLLARMGATVVHSADRLSLTGTDELVGIDVDLHDHGELAPVVAAVAALANGPSQLRGIAHLRRHETDRLAALATELGRLGGAARETDDGLVITPQPLHGGRFATYDDHRLVMAAAVLALVIDDIVVGDVITVAKTMPDFTERWDRMLAGTD